MKKKLLVSNKQEAYFRNRCLYWRDTWKLNNWDIEFKDWKEAKSDVESYAGGRHDVDNFHSVIYLCKDWTNKAERPLNNKELDKTARHEILHIFFAMKEEEAVVRLNKLL